MAIASETQTVHHWVGGGADRGTGDRYGEVTESATGEVVARVPFATHEDIDRVVRCAAEAAPEWGESSISARAKVLFRFRELLDVHHSELAEIITREHGKVLDDARGEVQRGIEVVEFACGLGHLLKGEMSGQISRGIDCYSLRQPMGVVGGITPFNFPFMVPMWMFPIALAAGNACICKPSEQDPSVSVRTAELLTEAGLPDGVYNVVHGDRVAVDAILEHPGISAVSFVGSTLVAKHIYETGTAHNKRVQALGGAKNHAIVLPDADLALAADSLVSAGYGSSGQRCMAVSVAVTVGGIAEPLIAAICERIDALEIGPGTLQAPTWVRWSAKRTVRGSLPTSTRVSRKALNSLSTGESSRSRTTSMATSRDRACSTACGQECASMTKKSSARFCSSSAPTATPRRSSSSTTTRTGTARRSSRTTMAPHVSSSNR